MAPITITTKNSSTAGSTSPAAAAAVSNSNTTNEVPIFLQKAYHMIDTCDPKICCWSDDGLTFIVKDTQLFETSIIPQFFKHNKFSSFVRQLNFYGFRKIKFSDSLRIDHKLEAETAKYWRFRQDKFRRGRMDLLSEIKRTPSSATSSSTTTPSFVSSSFAGGGGAAANLKNAVVGLHSTTHVVNPSSTTNILSTRATAAATTTTTARQANASSSQQPPEEVTHLKSEMQELKQRVDSMTKSIDKLTDLVKNVSVVEQEQQQEQEGGKSGAGRLVSPKAAAAATVVVEPERGNKRKKTDSTIAASIVKDEIGVVMEDDLSTMMPDWIHSSSDVAVGEMEDSLLFSDEALPDLTISTTTGIGGGRIGSSPTPSDDTFVDDLFQAFVGEDSILPELDSDDDDLALLDQQQHQQHNHHRITPDPLLMKRIEDSLSTLPREMHEMVANRLIDAISNSRPIVESASSLFPSCQQKMSSVCEIIAREEEEQCHVMDESADSPSRPANATTTISAMDTTKAAPTTIPLPLAVATLKTILAEYGVSVECTHRSSCKDAAASLENRTMFTKSLPVVPMNA